MTESFRSANSINLVTFRQYKKDTKVGKEVCLIKRTIYGKSKGEQLKYKFALLHFLNTFHGYISIMKNKKLSFDHIIVCTKRGEQFCEIVIYKYNFHNWYGYFDFPVSPQK